MSTRLASNHGPRNRPSMTCVGWGWIGKRGQIEADPMNPMCNHNGCICINRALQSLIQKNQVFPCTCTRKDIQAAGSAPHFDHEPAVYPGTCAGWNAVMRYPLREPIAGDFELVTTHAFLRIWCWVTASVFAQAPARFQLPRKMASLVPTGGRCRRCSNGGHRSCAW